MGGRAEGLACADPGSRTPIGASGNLIYWLWHMTRQDKKFTHDTFDLLIGPVCWLFISVIKAILGKKEEIRVITKNMNHFSNELRSGSALNIPCFYENGTHAKVRYHCWSSGTLKCMKLVFVAEPNLFSAPMRRELFRFMNFAPNILT